MRRIYSLLLVCCLTVGCWAQTQQGYVKTLGRPDKKGVALNGVSVRVKGGHNAVLSQQDGTFSMLLTGKKNGDSYQLQQVQKAGYELNEKGVLGRQYAFSDKVPLTIVMVSTAQLQADKQRIENNAYQVAEKNYKAKLSLLEKQREEQTITAEQYREELQDLQDKFEKYQSLIDDLSDHYAHVDYDNLVEQEREINLCIENGDLERADSLIHLLFDPVNVLKRNKEALSKIEEQMAQAQALRSQANEDMAVVLKQQEKDAEHLYQLYTIALAKFDNEKAAHYIEIRAALDTTNVEWQNQAGQFIESRQGDYSLALSYYQRVLRQSLLQYGEESEWTASGYNNIGLVYDEQGEYTKAMDFIQKAMTILEKVLEQDHLGVATTYCNIGGIYDDLGDYVKALDYYQRAMTIQEKVLGLEHPDVAITYNNIGLIYVNLGDYAKAKDYYQRAINIQEEVHGSEHLDVATSCNNIGNVYDVYGDYTKSLEYHQKALAIQKKVLGAEHPDVATSYNNIAGDYNNLGNKVMALEYLGKALAIQKGVLGPKHPNVATTYNNIGLIYDNLGDYSKALEYYQEALTIREKVLGPEHPDVATSYNNIGGTYYSLENYTKAQEYYQKVLAIFEKVLGTDHPEVATSYCNIGMVYNSLGDYVKALEYLQKALVIREKVLGAEHPDVATSYNNIGFVYSCKGEYTKAMDFIQKAMIIREKVLEPEHLDVAQSYNNIGSAYYYLGDNTKALEYLQKAQVIYEKVLGSEHPDVIAIQKTILAVVSNSYQNLITAINTPNEDLETISRFRRLMSECCFIATILDGDCPARQQGMTGEYILIEFADWNQDSTKSLFDKNDELRGLPKDLVVMKDGVISCHHFENTIGAQLGIKYVGIEERQRINKVYEEWKHTKRI